MRRELTIALIALLPVPFAAAQQTTPAFRPDGPGPGQRCR